MQRYPVREVLFTIEAILTCPLHLHTLTHHTRTHHTHTWVIGEVHLPDVAAGPNVTQSVC